MVGRQNLLYGDGVWVTQRLVTFCLAHVANIVTDWVGNG